MFYGQPDVHGILLDSVLYEKFFKEKRNGFFVECGAFDGLTECTCKFFEESMGWRGLNIEATPYAYNLLVKNRPNSINENYAISSKAGTFSFTNALHPGLGRHFGNGSLKHGEDHMKDLIATGCTFETFNVECIRFVDLYHKHSLPDIDLFVLDVEGHELDALQGIMEIPEPALPKVFCIEHTVVGLNKLSEVLGNLYDYHSEKDHNAFYVKKQ